MAGGTHFLRSMLAIGRLSTAAAVATYRRTIDARAGMGFYLEAEANELRQLLEERAAILERAAAAVPAAGSAHGDDSLPTEAQPGAPAQVVGGEA
jgi:sensor histidine kinase regulating citrate/malate metabolism